MSDTIESKENKIRKAFDLQDTARYEDFHEKYETCRF